MGRLNAHPVAADARPRLERWLANALNASGVRVEDVRLLSGGAIQQNAALTLHVDGGAAAGTLSAVLRRDAPATIDESRDRAQEHALLVAAHAAGVTVPEPIAFCADEAVIGAPFSLVRRVEGTALGQRVVKDASLGGDREALVERLGEELARIHAMDPDAPGLGFLRRAGHEHPARQAIDRLRASLDALGEARPALEAGLRWLELHAPAPPSAPGGRVLLHRDFRTGNFMLDAHGLTAVLDWEFAGTGDPFEDLGWFCARCWRFSRPDLEAGGLGRREAFYAGYERASGRAVDADAVHWWERYAHLRWAVIARQQGRRHASGRERSLGLALTGPLSHALELHVMDAMCAGAAAHDETTASIPVAEPDGPLDLLATARESLARHASDADDERRLDLLMATAAIGSAERMLLHASRADEATQACLALAGAASPAALVGAIRAGAHDRDAALHAALLRRCALLAWMARPGDVDALLRAKRGWHTGDGPPV